MKNTIEPIKLIKYLWIIGFINLPLVFTFMTINSFRDLFGPFNNFFIISLLFITFYFGSLISKRIPEFNHKTDIEFNNYKVLFSTLIIGPTSLFLVSILDLSIISLIATIAWSFSNFVNLNFYNFIIFLIFIFGSTSMHGLYYQYFIDNKIIKIGEINITEKFIINLMNYIYILLLYSYIIIYNLQSFLTSTDY